MHPAWSQLHELVNDQERKRFSAMTRKLMRGETVTPTEQEFERGFIAGMKYVVNNPSQEAKKMYSEGGDPGE
jgi:hypothetical protein